MLKFIFLLCIAFGIICEAKPKRSRREETEKVPIVNFWNITSYKLNEESNLLKDTGNGLLQWQTEVEEGEDDIMIYVVYDDRKVDLEGLCTSKNNSLSIFPDVLRHLLGITYCPIKKGTLTYLTNIYTYTNDYTKNTCEDPKDLTFELVRKQDEKEVMRMETHFKQLRLDDCKTD